MPAQAVHPMAPLGANWRWLPSPRLERPRAGRGKADANGGKPVGPESLSSRGDMVGQVSSRVDDSLLIREAQRGSRVAFEELFASTTRPFFAWRCT